MNNPWTRTCSLFRNAAVFIQDPALECLKWSCPEGLTSVFQLDALVYPFPPKEPVYRDKLVFIISHHLSNYAQLFKSILDTFPYTEVHLVACLSESQHMHELDENEGLVGQWSLIGDPVDDSDGYFNIVKLKLKQWMRESLELHNRYLNQDVICTVRYEPLIYAAVTDSLFMIPCKLFPPGELDLEAREFGYAVNGLLDHFQLKEQVYSLGPTSHLLGEFIVRQSDFTARRSSSREAALILVDRTLDLVGPASHSNNAMDLAYEFLPRHQQSKSLILNANELMSDRTLNKATSEIKDSMVVTLEHGQDFETMELMNLLSKNSIPDGLYIIRSKLYQLLGKYNDVLDMDLNKPPTLEHFQLLFGRVQCNLGLLLTHEPLITLSKAVIKAWEERWCI